MSEFPTPVEVPGHVLERVIGRGATSVVWAGRDSAGRSVALKVPHADNDDVDRQQSAAEREVLTALRHDHLVPLRAVVPLADGRVVHVFDLVEGASLGSTVEARGHLRTGEVVTVLTPLCDAVATLHRAGALHGDISPGNVLITGDGRPLLSDLGAARVAGAGAAVCGTRGYVAPEVLAGDAPTEASDVYAIGALAWFCLTGRGAPDTPIRLDLETVADEVGPELADLVAACIDPEPSRRPSSDRLSHDFFSATRAEPIEVVVGPDEASALTHRIRLNAVAPDPGASARRRRRAPAMLRGGDGMWGRGAFARRVLHVAGLAVIVLVGGGLAWSLVGSPAPSPPRPVSASAATSSAPTPPSRNSPRPPRDVLVDPLSPRNSPEVLLRVLAERRADLLVRRDHDALRGVHHDRSPSWAADESVLADLEERGLHYEGLGVAAVTALPVSVHAAKAVIRGRVDLTAYVVVDSSGAQTARPAAPGQELDFSLVQTAEGWRIESVSEPAST
jgi:serine/threonine-protein kinase